MKIPEDINKIPEFQHVIGMEGGDHHDEPVDVHMLNSHRIACEHTDNENLQLAILLHDIGKGQTQSFEAVEHLSHDMNGNEVWVKDLSNKKRIHFYQHENAGADLMKTRLKILKFSDEDITYITTLIKLHMWIHDTKSISKKAYIKFFNKIDEAKIPIEDVILMNYCDNQGNSANERVKFLEFLKCHRVYKKYYELKYSEEPMTVKDLKVKGQDVIDICKIKPGKRISMVLNILFENVMDGNVKNTRAELLHLLKRINAGEFMYPKFKFVKNRKKK